MYISHPSTPTPTPAPAPAPTLVVENPDEIMVDDEDDLDEEPIGETEEKELCSCDPVPPVDADKMAEDNPDEIKLDLEDEDQFVEPPLPTPASVPTDSSRTTKFLALSKPGGGRDFLQVSSLSDQSPES